MLFDDISEFESPDTFRRRSEVRNQAECSTLSICDTIDDGFFLVSNVKVDGSNYEKTRRENDRAEKEQRIKYIEREEQLAEAKFHEISKQWETIIKLRNPLDQYESTESHMGNQCRELLADKDKVIRKLKEVLKKADQKLQKDLERQTFDLTLLLSTISEQEKILKRAVLTQLSLIEETINTAANETKDEFNKLWEELDNEREETQATYISNKLKSIINHYDEIANHEVLLQEQSRSSRIRLDEDVQRIHRDLQDLKAVCLLNIEKMDYTTHLLRKQAEENKILKSQQDKTMIKIKSAVGDLKQTADSYRNNGLKIKKLRSKLNKLYNSIIIELEMRNFTDVHLKKFKQIWEFNKETADNILQKILSMDQNIVEQLFQLRWSAPESIYVKKLLGRDTKLLKHLALEGESRPKQNSEAIRRRSVVAEQDVLRQLLRIVVDSSGFLMEEKLFELLKPHSYSERLLVQLSNVFDALGIRNENDVYNLYNYLEPYIECHTCQNQSFRILESTHHEIDDFQENGSWKDYSPKYSKLESDGILFYLRIMIENRYKMIQDVVKEFTDHAKKRSEEESVDSWMLDQYQGNSSRLLSSVEHIAIRLRYKKPTVETRYPCRDPNHPLTISTGNLMKALQSLVCKLDEEKCLEYPVTLYDRIENLPPSKYSHIGDDDIVNFWNGYKDIFSMEDERQWNALFIGLREYYDELKERHYLNTEVRKLRLENLALEKKVDIQTNKKKAA